MFDPHAFLPSLQVAGHLSRHMAVDFTRRRELLTQKPQHVWTTECGHGVMHQQWIEPPQVLRLAEHDVGGPLALVGGPIITERKTAEDLLVNRVQQVGDPIQHFRPVRFQ